VDLLLIQSLVAVTEHGTVTRAARALAVTQPALSRRLQQLEEELGSPLFVRSKRGVSLTEAGRLVVAEGKHLLDRYSHMRMQIDASHNLEHGRVRIGGGATAVSFVAPVAIAEFSKQYPKIRFEVREEGSRDVEADVLAERLDLGIVTLPTLASRSRELEVRPLRRDRIVLIASSTHPLARKKRVHVGELAGFGMIGFESDSAIRRLIDDALQSAGIRLQVQMELRSFAAIVEMVAHTELIAFVSQLGVQGRDQRVRIVEVSGLTLFRRLAVVHKSHRPLSPAALAFASMLK